MVNEQAPTHLTPEEDPALTLVAQIRAITAIRQREIVEGADNVASLSASATLSREVDTSRALDDFHDNPVSRTFSRALGSLLLQTAQAFALKLRALEPVDERWRRISGNVLLFESLAFFWCALSFHVHDIVRYEFDADREAVTAAMLGAYSAAGAMLSKAWTGFSPEAYAMSRIMLYPQETTEAAECLCRMLTGSEGLLLPLSPNDVREVQAGSALNESGRVLLADIHKACAEINPRLREIVSGMLSHYLEQRLD